MTPAELRERIAAALRAHFDGADVRVWSWRVTEFPRPVYRAAFKVDDRASGDVPEHAHELDALASLAVTIGLNADGTDPREELAAARERAAIEAMQRRALCNEGNRLGEQLGWERLRAVSAELEAERLERELAEARSLLHGGRTPTDAQIEAHEGKWLIVKDHSSGYAASVVGTDDALETARYEREHPGSGYVWHAIDEASGAIVPPPKGE